MLHLKVSSKAKFALLAGFVAAFVTLGTVVFDDGLNNQESSTSTSIEELRLAGPYDDGGGG